MLWVMAAKAAEQLQSTCRELKAALSSYGVHVSGACLVKRLLMPLAGVHSCMLPGLKQLMQVGDARNSKLDTPRLQAWNAWSS